MAATLILLSGCGVAAALWYLRAEAIESGETLNEALAHVIEEQTSRSLQAADQRLQLASRGLKTLEAEQRLSEDSVRSMLREQLKDLAFVRAMWVVGPDGRILFDSDVGNIGISLADREYFSIYREKPNTEFYISAPILSRSKGTWLISASRPLRSASGKVVGVMVAAIEPPYFDQLWRKLDIGANGAVALFRRDGVLMMRSPTDEKSIGKTFLDLPVFASGLPKSPQGSYRTISAFDGQERLVSYRTLSTYPDLIVNVGRSHQAVIASWTRFATLAFSIWLGASVLLGLLLTVLRRQSRQHEQNELRFHRLAQAMPQIVFMTDANGILTYVNNQWTTVTGQPPAAALAGGWMQRVHPDDVEEALQAGRLSMDTGTTVPNEHRLMYADGSYRWQLARATPNFDSAGRIVSWYGTSTDIDDLKQADAALKAQAGLMKVAGKISRLGGWAMDVDSGRFVWSDEARLLLGLNDDGSTHLESAIEVCAPEWREVATRVAQDCVSYGTPFDLELEMITPGGRKVWVRSMGQATRDSNGNITGMQGALQDITERKLAAQALVESEQRHAALFDAAPVPMWVMDKSTLNHIAVNEAAVRNYGYSLDELKTMTPSDLRPPTEQARIHQLMAEGLPYNTPELWLHRRKDGTEFPVELIRQEIRYAGRDAIFAVAFDVSERVKAEQDVQAYLKTLQRAADAAQLITQQRSVETVTQVVADEVRNIIGAHQAIVSLSLNADWAQAINGISLSEKYAAYREWMEKTDGSGIYSIVCESNQPIRLTQAEREAHPRWRGFGKYADKHPAMRGWLAVPLIGRDGANMGLLQLSDKEEGDFSKQDEYVAAELAQLASIAIDNVKLLEQIKDLNSGLEEKIATRTSELSRQEALLRTLAEQAPEPIWTINPKGSVTFISKAWYDLAGGSPPDWYGFKWIKLVHPDDMESVTQTWMEAEKTGKPYSGLRRLKAIDGSYHTMSYRASPVFDEEGKIIFWVGIDVDITEIKAIETALRLSNAELEAFSYSVSHDLRSPLNTVDGFSRLLAKELGSTERGKVQHYLTRIQNGVSQMGNLIEGLLTLAHVARQELRHEVVDLSAIANEIMERLQASDRNRQAMINIEANLVVHGDSRLIRSVLENLLGNAWKFSARKTNAEISFGRSAQAGAFFVRDNGAGFDMAYADKLFGTFQRLHGVTEYAGTGIGLATAARVIQRHGGRIWADAAPDKGATFFFTLPGSANQV
ncbi:MAG TPA: PAS domain S-box protein [Polaromonas sp.]|uniref:PAS domain S-box protein n=1 Tax=Polaromonas sp. TaxID=1869339 RepID=UPI002D3D9147|nr:PAS domain S-box protein [Polaromonas sp.]HYW57846.1 PAS domain S-box protein [Polaromonas sp.]